MEAFMRSGFLALAGVALCLSTPALADDSSAAMGMGGVVLTQSANIRMAKEDLYVSPAQVRIRFEFVNDSAKDIDTIVAFPLPDIDVGEYTESAMGTITEDPVNFVGFRTVSNGVPVTARVEQRAFHNGRDVTAVLAAAGVPLNVVNNGAFKILEALPAAKKQALIKAGILEVDGDNIHPDWTVRTRFWWTQHFPAGKTVVLTHTYQPVTGGFFFPVKADETDKDAIRNYCVDAGGMAAARRLKAEGAKANSEIAQSGYLNASNTDYILMSGNNWKGPIGHFHLTLDKLKPANILSTCWSGTLTKTGATTFEATEENFSPKADIKLLVLTDMPAQ
jgi:hypothetical protein